MSISNSRSLSRLAAVQTLYQYDFNEKMNLKELKSINDMEISEIYEIICEEVEGEYVEPVYKISSDKEIKSQYLDTTQIESDLNVKSIFSIEDSIRLTVDWYKKYFLDK